MIVKKKRKNKIINMSTLQSFKGAIAIICFFIVYIIIGYLFFFIRKKRIKDVNLEIFKSTIIIKTVVVMWSFFTLINILFKTLNFCDNLHILNISTGNLINTLLLFPLAFMIIYYICLIKHKSIHNN